jgi:BirA family biotin operon repressor/biotin-[acetyl-CoA-carboxylase] ligase
MKPADEVWELPHRHVGRRVLRFARLPSTNDYAATLAHDPANAGVAILADEQSAGRGQYGREWHAPAGSSVLLSALLFPPPELRRPAVLTAWAAVSVAEVILKLTGQQAKIKWPNDILLHGKKVCGVLIEQGRGGVIAGVGLNLNQSAADFIAMNLPLAGSLAAAMGQQFDSRDVTRVLLAEMDAEYDLLTQGDFGSLEACWKRRLGLIGCAVIAECFDGTRVRGRLVECGFGGIDIDAPVGLKRLAPEQVRSLLASPVGEPPA